jgi:metal-responsive CopG/Arc/MetJ family transcriptional regulator
MSIAEKFVRQSVSLPARVARRVKSLAQTSKTSTSRVIADLIETGLDAREQKKSASSNSPTASRAAATRRSRNVSRKNSPA